MLSNNVIRKFIDIISIKNWQVLSNTGWNDIDSINKTIKYDTWKIVFSDNSYLICADNHILVDINGNEVYARDSRPFKFLNKNNIILTIKNIYPLNQKVHMYDLALSNNTNHLYYTNGILSHNSTSYSIYVLWYTIFNPEKKILIAANKKATSLDILSKIQLAYELLPNWIKPGLTSFKKGEMSFGNRSTIVAEATSSDAARGTSCNILVLDEFAFAEQPDKFWASVYPIVSSDVNSKVIIVSTPNGVGNLFHKLWEKANANGADNDDGWVPFRVDWWEVPDRDEKWKQQQIASLGNKETFEQEFGNSFISSTWKKLIPDDVIMRLRQKNSSISNPEVDMIVNDKDPKCKFTYTEYYKFDPRKTYLAAGDSSEGTGGDNSVLYIFDITKFNNIKLCAKFSQNNVSTTEFAYVIYYMCKKYYNPWLAIERNTTGATVLDALCSTVYNYENVMILNKHGKPGIMSHMQIKQKACLWIRELLTIEDYDLEILDNKCIDEMDTFIKKDTAQHIVYSAMVKKHDDHIMSLIWGIYVLTPEILQQYYNIVDWETTSIGKQLPGHIVPMTPYDISNTLYNEMLKEVKDTTGPDINKLMKDNELNKRSSVDRFFGDEEFDAEFHQNAMHVFNNIKTDSDFKSTLTDDLEDTRFYNNMIF